MSVMNVAELKAGRIFGDPANNEYLFMPAGEIGVQDPLCIYETHDNRQDLTLQDALHLIQTRSLRPTVHPRLGTHSC